jgi:hypothetical protein
METYHKCANYTRSLLWLYMVVGVKTPPSRGHPIQHMGTRLAALCIDPRKPSPVFFEVIQKAIKEKTKINSSWTNKSI